MKYACKNCGKLFVARKYDYEHEKTITCSEECRQERQRAIRAEARKGFYFQCSLPSCKNVVYRTASKVSSATTGYFFCCREHQVQARQDLADFQCGAAPKTDEFNYRLRAIKAYGALCEECGFAENVQLLDVHHIDENRKHNKIENLIVLCVMCHAKVTRKLAEIINRKLVSKGS